MGPFTFFFFSKKNSGGHKSFLWCESLFQMSALGFKAREDPLLTCFLTFTTGVTPAYCIKVGIATESLYP